MLEVRVNFNITTYSTNAVTSDHNEPIYCIGYNNVTSKAERVVSKILICVRGNNNF